MGENTDSLEWFAITRQLPLASPGARAAQRVSLVGAHGLYGVRLAIPINVRTEGTAGGDWNVLYDWAGGHRVPQRSYAILNDFVQLTAADDQAEFESAVVAFIGSHGLLGFCPHQLSQMSNHTLFKWGIGSGGECVECDVAVLRYHLSPSEFANVYSFRPPIRPEDFAPLPQYREPLLIWAQYARQAGALLGLLADLRAGHEARTEDRELIEPLASSGYGEDPDRPDAVVWDNPWGCLVSAANNWLLGTRPWLNAYLGSVEDAIDTDEPEITFAFAGTTAFQVLGSRFAQVLARRIGVYRCDRCDLPYTLVPNSGDPSQRVRRPWKDHRRHHYCPKCREENSLAIKRDRARAAYQAKHPDAKRRRKPVENKVQESEVQPEIQPG